MPKKLLTTLAFCSALTVLSAPHAALAAAPPESVKHAIQAAPEADLRITYHTMSIGSDGVRRDSEYTNRVFRRPGQLWVERELPEALLHSQSHGHEHPHGPHAGHAHDDARGAPLFIQRAPDGQLKVEVILAKLKRVISVDEAHHANVGFGGSFDNTYWIVPPSALEKMERVGKPQGGVQRYRSVAGELTTLVDWDLSGQYARRVERNDGHGIERVVISAKRLPLPLAQPWKTIEGYERGDYSDLLD